MLLENVTKEKRSISAKCGHVLKAIKSQKPLSKKTLEFALQVIDEQERSSNDNTELKRKLINGIPLSDYEIHIMEEGYLLHKKLGLK